MLAHDDPLTWLQMQRGDVARCVAAERNFSRRLCLEHQQWHPAENPALEALLQRMHPDLHLRVLPQQDVMLEVHRHLAVERHVQHRDELSLKPVIEPGRGALGDLSRENLRCGRHGPLFSRGFLGTVPG